MRTQYRSFTAVLAGLIVIRLLLMAIIPLTDPTEARYAEIARIMAESGDWVTPYFKYGVPFWGKPPLSFWLAAISIKVLGLSEFSIRLPSLLVTILTALLIHLTTKHYTNSRAAYYSSLIFLSTTLVFVSSGAVFVDPFLVFGTTLSMTSFVFSIDQKQTSHYWDYLFYAGITIGLLAKGPLALVIIFGPILLWMLICKDTSTAIRRLLLSRKALLAAALVLPWYIIAELKTPGFLEYFIIGEHFKRFLVSGWNGDLYGSAHKHPIGSVWSFFFIGVFPWSFILAIPLLKFFKKYRQYTEFFKMIENKEMTYLFISALFPMIFFTLSKNVLWTYVLPSIPAFSVLLGIYLDNLSSILHQPTNKIVVTLALIVPSLSLLTIPFLYAYPERVNTDKYSIVNMKLIMDTKIPLYVAGDISHSARFYLESKGKFTQRDVMPGVITDNEAFYVILPNTGYHQYLSSIKHKKSIQYWGRDFVLIKVY